MGLRRPIAVTLLAPLLLAAPLAAQPQQPAGDLTPREEQVLKRIRELKGSAWRRFGACRYDWGSWRLSGGGVRVTLSECGEPPTRTGMAVHCDTFKVARRTGEDSWEAWRLPLSIEESKDLGGEDRMVASLCANLKQPAPATPKPTTPKPGTPKPASPPAAGTKKPPAAEATGKPAEPKPASPAATPSAPQSQ
jgi:hypothetical protein